MAYSYANPYVYAISNMNPPSIITNLPSFSSDFSHGHFPIANTVPVQYYTMSQTNTLSPQMSQLSVSCRFPSRFDSGVYQRQENVMENTGANVTYSGGTLRPPNEGPLPPCSTLLPPVTASASASNSPKAEQCLLPGADLYNNGSPLVQSQAILSSTGNRSSAEILHPTSKSASAQRPPSGVNNRPIGKPRRRRWEAYEDDLLIRLVRHCGPCQWAFQAKHFDGRNGRQVRLRWVNHLDPMVRKGDWTKDEEEYIFKRHKEIGNKWSIIAQELPGRTDNAIKNRLKVILRRKEKEEKEKKMRQESEESASSAAGSQLVSF